VNCRVLAIETVGSVGDTVTATAGRMVTMAVTDLDGSAIEVAVTFTSAGLGTLPGAV
jgi:hypothetical protein